MPMKIEVCTHCGNAVDTIFRKSIVQCRNCGAPYSAEEITVHSQAEYNAAVKAAKIEVYLDVMDKMTHIDKYTNSYWEYCRDAITELENG